MTVRQGKEIQIIYRAKGPTERNDCIMIKDFIHEEGIRFAHTDNGGFIAFMSAYGFHYDIIVETKDRGRGIVLKKVYAEIITDNDSYKVLKEQYKQTGAASIRKRDFIRTLRVYQDARLAAVEDVNELLENGRGHVRAEELEKGIYLYRRN